VLERKGKEEEKEDVREMEEKARKGELVYRDNENYLRKREKMYSTLCKLLFVERINVVDE
jgi:hypothetical protein